MRWPQKLFVWVKAKRRQRRIKKIAPHGFFTNGTAIGCYGRGWCCDRAGCEFAPKRSDIK